MEPFNAGDRKAIRAAEKSAKLVAAQNREAVIAIMSTQAGRTWMHGKLLEAHLFTDPFTGDALLEAYNKGERNFGLRLLNDLMAYCPDDYIQMMREANGRRTELAEPQPDGGNATYDSDADSLPDAEHSGGAESGRVAEGRVTDFGADLYVS